MPVVLPPGPLPVRALRVSLVLGALVDLSGGIPLLVKPEMMSRMFGAPVDGLLVFWPSYAAVFLFVLPMFYLISALNPTRSLANLAAVIAGRLLGVVAYAYWWTRLGHPLFVAGLFFVNLAFAVHLYLELGSRGRALLRQALHVSDAP